MRLLFRSPRSSSRRLPPPELAQISLDNVPVRAAVARFNRVNSTKIILADSAIGDVEIIGLYRANDPEQFAEAVAAISGARVEQSGSNIVRSEEHTSELQSLMRISYAVFC